MGYSHRLGNPEGINTLTAEFLHSRVLGVWAFHRQVKQLLCIVDQKNLSKLFYSSLHDLHGAFYANWKKYSHSIAFSKLTHRTNLQVLTRRCIGQRASVVLQLEFRKQLQNFLLQMVLLNKLTTYQWILVGRYRLDLCGPANQRRLYGCSLSQCSVRQHLFEREDLETA